MRPIGRRAVAAVAAMAALGCASDPPPLLLLITVDTLRADRLGSYGSALGLTPNLDTLASESAVFDSAWAPAPFTRPSVAALLTGRYPAHIGVVTNRSVLPADVPTLAGALAGRGWRTGAVVSNWILREQAGLARGFAHYDARLPQREGVRPVPERTAPDTTDAALEMLDALAASPGRGVFVWVHYQDPHGPYTPPESLRDAYLPAERAAADGGRELPVQEGSQELGALPAYQAVGDRRDVAFYRAGYDGEVRYADEEIGRLLEGLRERGLYDDAVIAFAADHGEALGEGDYWFAHEVFLNEPLVRVPLFVRVPGRTPARVAEPVSLVDLAPTLLGAVLADGGEDLGGSDLLAASGLASARPAWFSALGTSETTREGIGVSGFRLVRVQIDDDWHVTLATLDREAPTADADLAEITRELEAQLDALGVAESIEQRLPLGPGEREKLRALGYTGDGWPDPSSDRR